jgi:hypothetical protein
MRRMSRIAIFLTTDGNCNRSLTNNKCRPSKSQSLSHLIDIGKCSNSNQSHHRDATTFLEIDVVSLHDSWEDIKWTVCDGSADYPGFVKCIPNPRTNPCMTPRFCMPSIDKLLPSTPLLRQPDNDSWRENKTLKARFIRLLLRLGKMCSSEQSNSRPDFEHWNSNGIITGVHIIAILLLFASPPNFWQPILGRISCSLVREIEKLNRANSWKNE